MVSQEVIDEFYAGVHFDNTLESLQLDDYRLELSDDVSDRAWVMATAARRGSPIISSSDGSSICCVYAVVNDDPLMTDGPEMMTMDDLVERMPRKMRNANKKVIPSLKGQYLEVMEWDARIDDDGITHLRSGTTMYWIPVEWVRKRIYYDDETTEYNP